MNEKCQPLDDNGHRIFGGKFAIGTCVKCNAAEKKIGKGIDTVCSVSDQEYILRQVNKHGIERTVKFMQLRIPDLNLTMENINGFLARKKR